MKYMTPEIEMMELDVVDVITGSLDGDTTNPDGEIVLPDDALPVG